MKVSLSRDEIIAEIRRATENSGRGHVPEQRMNRELDTLDLTKEESGTFVMQTNSPEGRIAIRLWMHPMEAEAIRDFLNANYPKVGISQWDSEKLDLLLTDLQKAAKQREQRLDPVDTVDIIHCRLRECKA